MSEKPERKSLRLHDYDYHEEGGYFVTICTHERKMLFGEILAEGMNLNALGEISEQCWNEFPQHFSSVQLDSFVIVPNHVHVLVFINRYGLEASYNSPSQGETLFR